MCERERAQDTERRTQDARRRAQDEPRLFGWVEYGGKWARRGGRLYSTFPQASAGRDCLAAMQAPRNGLVNDASNAPPTRHGPFLRIGALA
jgi:hypothetical protein